MASNKRVVVVTGGAGFIGSNVAAAFAATADVVVCDRLGRDERWRNLAKHDVADIVAPERFDEFLAAHRGAIDTVVHMGAITSTTERDADLLARDNYGLSRRIWAWCAEHGTRLIYASSAATYGGGGAGFRDDESREALAVLRPLNAYGWSKHAFDRWVARTLAGGGPHPPQWAGLKFFNVYGPNEYHKGEMKSVIAKIYPEAAAGRAVRLFRSHRPDYADGGQSRDFIWVGDCVRVISWLARTPSVNGLFNVGTGKARSFADLARSVFAAAGREPRIEYVDTPPEIRERYQYFTQADMSKLAKAGYREPFTELEDGVGEYVRDYLATDDPYR